VKLGLSCGDHRWFKRSTRKKTPVTRNDYIDDDDDDNNLVLPLDGA